jgi:hypothetical protein
MLTPSFSVWGQQGSDATAKIYLFLTELLFRFYNFQSQKFKNYFQLNNLSIHKKRLAGKIRQAINLKTAIIN